MAETITVKAQQGEALDALVWRALGQTSGVVETVLMLNRDIASQGAILTEGQEIILPNLLTKSVPQMKIVQLWD
ncbi:hypothetical protein MMA231_02476 [Asticcacaulis sp. MM231]|uniref:tail protein X n=1 Tax=Asticcacaulis sp. MM231 TaxID=3157666 RepID=UPI0032D5A6EA